MARDFFRDELKLYSGAESLMLSQCKAGWIAEWSDTQALTGLKALGLNLASTLA